MKLLYNMIMHQPINAKKAGWIAGSGVLLISSVVSGALALFALSSAADAAAAESLLRQAVIPCVLISLISSLTAGVFVFWIVRRAVDRPLERLQDLRADDESQSLFSASINPELRLESLVDLLMIQQSAYQYSEERYRHLFENSCRAAYVLDAGSLNIMEANREAESATGFRARQFQGHFVEEFVDPADRERLNQWLKCADGTVSNELQLRHCHRYKEFIPVRARYSRFQDHESELILLTFEDMSELRQKDLQISEHLAQLELLDQLGATIVSSLDLRRICRSLYRTIMQIVPLHCFMVELYEQDREEMTHVFSLARRNDATSVLNETQRARLLTDDDHRVLDLDECVLMDRVDCGTVKLNQAFCANCAPLPGLLLPLVVGTKKIGIVSIISNALKNQSDAHLRVLKAMCRQAALSMENAKLYQQNKDAAENLHILQELSATLYREPDPHELLNRLVRSAWKALPNAEAVMLQLAHENNEHLEISAAYGFNFDEEIIGAQLGLHEGLGAQAIKMRRPIALQGDQITEGTLLSPANQRLLRRGEDGIEPRASLAVPVFSSKGPVGAILALNYQNEDAFSAADLGLMQSLANEGGIAIENLHLVQEIQKSQQDYRTLIEYAPLVIIGTDLSGTVNIYNHVASETLGIPQTEALGRKFYRLIQPTHDQRRLARLLRQSLKFGRILKDIEVEIECAGETRQLRCSSSSLYSISGERSGMMIIGVDVTETKKLQMHLNHAQKMESIGTLAGGVAHDFNNLLTGVLGYSSYLLSKLNPGDEHYKEISQIERSATKAAALTAQLLAFGRKRDMSRSAMQVNKAIEETVAIFARTFPKSISIEVDLDADLNPISADMGQLQQVIMNLGINARDAMKEGGVLRMRTRNVTQSSKEPYADMLLRKPGPYILLELSDTGHGMDEAIQQRVFDPFFTTKQPGEGTGLGLSMVYSIVKEHGGFIFLESKSGVGTAFKVYLPALDRAADTVGAWQSAKIMTIETPAPNGDNGVESILIVDDEEMIIGLACNVLQRAGYRVLTASNGEKALETFDRCHNAIDLVVLDMVMPGMSGREVYQHLLKRKSGVRVLFSSGYTAENVVDDLIKHNDLAGFIAKPYRVDQLLSEVRRLLDQKDEDSGRHPAVQERESASS
ncbi:PAS domain S-box protein [Candidatus Sumerlaeota bacterium]|nr:PAS domain S-box protein [Candidatus Sumerlaeota bacterium]